MKTESEVTHEENKNLIRKKISYFKSSGDKIGAKQCYQSGLITIEDLINQMTDSESKLKVQFERLRDLKLEDEDKYISAKLKLPYFTINGQFPYRNNESLIAESYTWLMSIDIDAKDNLGVDMDMVKNIITSEDSVIFCGKSPSGKGLKIIIRLKERAYNIDDHRRVLIYLYKNLEKDLGCSFDYAQATLSQPFYLTFDENAYTNLDAIELDCDYTLPDTLRYDNNSDQFVADKNNNKDYLIKNKCNEILGLKDNKWTRCGAIGFSVGGWYANGYFTYSEKEILTLLNNAVSDNGDIKDKLQKYKQIENSFRNGTTKPLYIKTSEPEVDDQIDELENSKLIPDEVYQNLPRFLKETCAIFDKSRKKDIFLLSELTCMSVLFPTVSGIYMNDPTFANLFLFVAAPAGNNKHVTKYANGTLYQINTKIKDDFILLKKQLTDEELKLNDIKEKRLLIQGNTSAASFISELNNNGGSGLIFEEEADTITQLQKQDWGDYSDSLRKGFEHEKISSSRKGEGIIEIDTPKLSVCISGTIGQLISFIPSSENGLFSRFIYYTFKENTKYQNPFLNTENFKVLFENKYSFELLQMYEYYQNDEFKYNLTEKQAEQFFNEFHEKLESTKSFFIERDIEATVLRLGKICFRISMILSILRNFEKNNIFDTDHSKTIVCEDVDFNTAIEISKTLLEHSKLIFQNMPKKDNIIFTRNNNDKLFNALEVEFSRQDVINLSEKNRYNISVPTIDRLLQKWKKQCIVKKKDKYIYVKI